MATVTRNVVSGQVGEVTITETTLTATNDFVFVRNGGQTLFLRNDTGGAIAVNIDGDGGSTVSVDGVGDVDVSGGFDLSVGAGELAAIKLDTIYHYLSGTITMTGENLIAYIVE